MANSIGNYNGNNIIKELRKRDLVLIITVAIIFLFILGPVEEGEPGGFPLLELAEG